LCRADRQIYRWRQELGQPRKRISRVVIAATDVGSDDRAALDHMPMIEVELAGATRLRIPASTPPNWRRPLRQ
jgi:hypothetical protein